MRNRAIKAVSTTTIPTTGKSAEDLLQLNPGLPSWLWSRTRPLCHSHAYCNPVLPVKVLEDMDAMESTSSMLKDMAAARKWLGIKTSQTPCLCKAKAKHNKNLYYWSHCSNSSYCPELWQLKWEADTKKQQDMAMSEKELRSSTFCMSEKGPNDQSRCLLQESQEQGAD